jgi:hypothetical protein
VKQEEIIARNVVEILRKKGALSALLDPPSPNPPLIARDQALPETTPFFPSAHRQPPIPQVQPGHPLSGIPMSSMSTSISGIARPTSGISSSMSGISKSSSGMSTAMSGISASGTPRSTSGNPIFSSDAMSSLSHLTSAQLQAVRDALQNSSAAPLQAAAARDHVMRGDQVLSGSTLLFPIAEPRSTPTLLRSSYLAGNPRAPRWRSPPHSQSAIPSYIQSAVPPYSQSAVRPSGVAPGTNVPTSSNPQTKDRYQQAPCAKLTEEIA